MTHARETIVSVADTQRITTGTAITKPCKYYGFGSNNQFFELVTREGTVLT